MNTLMADAGWGFDVELERRGGDAVRVSVSGELDVATAPALRTALMNLIDDGVTTIELDIHAVSFIDSTGLGVLVGARRRMLDHDGRLVIVNPTVAAMRVIEITGLTALFEVVRDLDA